MSRFKVDLHNSCICIYIDTFICTLSKLMEHRVRLDCGGQSALIKFAFVHAICSLAHYFFIAFSLNR